MSVIVVNWNRRELLGACLRSVAAQTGTNFEVIVVDNGSSDGSADMVEQKFHGRCAFPVTLIRNTENRGFCAANNQGIAAARGEFIALLNNDAEPEPGWLSALGRAFDQADVGMAASKVLVWEDPGRIDKAGHLIYPDGQNRGRGHGEQDRGQFDREEEVLWPDGCAAMYRRAMLDQIGGFDEDFFAYADDAELGLRGRIAGWRCRYVPDAIVRHHRGSTLGLLSVRRLALIERNRILLVVKLFPWSLACLNGFYLAARLAAGAWAAIWGEGEASRFPGLRGKAAVALGLIEGNVLALLLIPKMMRKRRAIERFRVLSPSQVRALILAHRITLRELSRQAV